MVQNFDAGIGLVDADRRAPINEGHNTGGKAFGWLTRLFTEKDGEELWAETKWTPGGSQALRDEEYAYISAEVWPREMPWEDPENEGVFVENVLDGAALTNIPLFKKLKPVMASRVTGGGDNQRKEGEYMLKLEEVRVKKPEDLTDEEKAFLVEHKAELTDEERKTFGLVDEDAEAKAKAEAEAKEKEEAERKAAEEKAAAEAEEEKKRLEASAKGMTAERLAKLEADAKAGREAQQELLRTKLAASVESHVKRGAIKSDQADEAVSILMASGEKQRERLEKFFSSLPDSPVIGAEKGKGVKASAAEVEITDEERQMGAAFNLTDEQIAEYKKAQEAAN